MVADSVNPLKLTRDAWIAVANRAGARAIEVELTCSDAEEHRRRVETRTNDIAGLRLPTWSEVAGRNYHAWERGHITIDTAGRNVDQCVRMVRESLKKAQAVDESQSGS